MIKQLKPYPQYKDSGVPWLGKVPAHWGVLPFKRYFTVAMGQTILATELQENGKYPVFSATEGKNYFGKISNPRFILTPGDLVIPARGVSIGSVKIVTEPCVCTQTTIYAKKAPNVNIESKYVFYFLLGCRRWLFEYDRTAIPQLTVDQVRNNPLLIFPLTEQAAIVRFLDWAEGRIRKAIRLRQRRIQLLQEYKQALIHQAVTGQIDVRTGQPYPAYKDSGVEWLGKVPKHWEVRRLKFIAKKFGSGITPRGGATIYVNSGIPFLRSQNIHFEGLRLENVVKIPKELHEILRETHVKPGDVLLNITGASIGRVCSVPKNFLEGNINQHVCIIRPIKKFIESDFLASFLSIPAMQHEIMTEQSGASREGLTLDSIKNFKILLPPKIEQILIVEFINAKTQIINKAISADRRAIELLKELRTTLIAEVVTGKLDVRKAAANLPEAPESEAEDLEEIEEEPTQTQEEETLLREEADD